MAILEKPEYFSVPDDESSQSASEQDDLLYDGTTTGSRRRSTSLKTKVYIGVGVFIFLGVYAALVATLTSMW